MSHCLSYILCSLWLCTLCGSQIPNLSIPLGLVLVRLQLNLLILMPEKRPKKAKKVEHLLSIILMKAGGGVICKSVPSQLSVVVFVGFPPGPSAQSLRPGPQV